MDIKLANCIDAEKNSSKEVSIFLQDNGCRDFETIKDLIETMDKDKQYAEENNLLEAFLNKRISLQLVDIEGQVVTGDMNLCVGWCEDKLILTGNIQSVDFVKEVVYEK